MSLLWIQILNPIGDNFLVVCCYVDRQEKTSRIDRIATEHQLFSQGLKELQNWVADTSHMLQTYCAPTSDKNVLDSRMIKLEVLKVTGSF